MARIVQILYVTCLLLKGEDVGLVGCRFKIDVGYLYIVAIDPSDLAKRPTIYNWA